MKIFFTIFCLLVGMLPLARAQQPSLPATRATSPPKLDGNLDDACWQNVPVADQFKIYQPDYGKDASQRTEVKLLYDNNAIYIGAYLYDTQPDKIKKQLTERDGIGLSDDFIIGFDTYDDDLNGYRFIVTAAGVQVDERASPTNNNERSWDAVWDSKVSIKSDGWVVEVEIPYSAIRFPSKSPQNWGLQFGRDIVRTGELNMWSLVDPQVSGIINQWGSLNGLENIKPPLRLSLSPYLTAGFQTNPVSDDPPEYHTDKLFGGGLDLKWGINESFTLDATLIPDFGQVQSDNLVLNISPFETQFDEKRPFFTEGTEIFNQGNPLFQTGTVFYSRRIGGLPPGYYDARDEPGENETLEKNPSDTKLYNATKFSGRTNGGLGIGVLNSISQPTYATISNDETGETRDFLTSPLTNYSVIVFDQSLKNNSKVSFENTNVWREGSYTDANVSSLNYDLRNKANSLEFSGYGNFSQRHDDQFDPNPETGIYYLLGASEIKGKWNFDFFHSLITKDYNQNDLGLLYYSNEMTNFIGFRYNNQEMKSGPFYYMNAWSSINYKTQVEPLQYEEWETNAGWQGNFKNFWYIGGSFYSKPFYYWDYYEPRVEGRKYYHHPFYVFNLWGGTDYRKKISLNWSAAFAEAPEPNNPFWEIDLFPNFVISDKFSISYGFTISRDFGTYGYADELDNGDIIFGQRNTATVINSLESKFIFNPKMNISFRSRYYWSKVNYTGYYLLLENGELGDTEYNENNDINFNVFNIDAVYAWEFAPGSFLNVIWKNNIFQDDNEGADNYFTNCSKTFETPQSNGVSVKLIYYLDYLKLRKSTGS
jgi:hypothetical protein